MITLAGFTPDVDPTTPGAIVDCENIIPTVRGIKGAPGPTDVGLPALTGECRGAAYLARLDGLHRMVVGTTTGLFEVGTSALVDISKSGGYTEGAENKWRFAQFGNASLAANGIEKIQASTSGAFADISDAPIASIIDTASGFVLAFNISSALIGNLPHGWACSHIYDHTTWKPADSNQAAWGMLMDTPGEIRAGKRLGQNIVAYKERSMYLGQYVGSPVVWQWQLVASDIGAISQECVIDTGTAHVFIGRDDFWLFDGSRPQQIGSPVREWFFDALDKQYAHRIQGAYDRFNHLAWWFFPSKDSAGALSAAIVYNAATNKWGYAKLNVNAVFDYQSPELTWDDWPAGISTFEDFPDVSFDSPAWDSSAPKVAIVGGDNKIKALSGACESAYLVTADMGDDALYTTLTSVLPRFIERPATSEMTHYTRDYSGGSLTQRSTSTLAGNKYDCLFSGLWHTLKLEFTGDFEIAGFDVKQTAGGEA